MAIYRTRTALKGTIVTVTRTYNDASREVLSFRADIDGFVRDEHDNRQVCRGLRTTGATLRVAGGSALARAGALLRLIRAEQRRLSASLRHVPPQAELQALDYEEAA